MSKNARIAREKYGFNNRVVSLDHAKELLLKDNHARGIDLTFTYFMTFPGIPTLHEKNVSYLHYLIMLSTPKNVNAFCQNHYNKFGEYATQMLVNFPLVSIADNNVVTAMMCAAMWSNNPDMARILFYWGADLSIGDINGKYPEEKYGSFYVNHLNHLLAPNYFILGIRSIREFRDMGYELRILSGEIEPPMGWRWPGAAHNINVSCLTEAIPEEPGPDNPDENA
jgi:hypothetical protein